MVTYLNNFSIFLILTTFAEVGFGKNRISEVSGVIPNNLPMPMPTDYKMIEYNKPGELKVSTVQFCGDGDVAHYAKSHPNVSFVTKDTVKFVMGYWSSAQPVKSKNSKFLITNSNWNTLGYYEGMKSDQDSTTEFIDIDSGEKMSSMLLASKAMKRFERHKGYAMAPKKNSPQYATYLGVLMCKEFEKKNPTGIKSEQLLQLFGGGQAIGSIQQSIKKDVIDGNMSNAALFSIQISNDTVSLSPSGTTQTVAKHPFYALAKKIRVLKAPNTNDLANYRASLDYQTKNQSVALANSLNSASDCRDLSGAQKAKYWWEHVPQGATCAALGTRYIEAVNELFALGASAEAIDPAQFDILKVELATRLITAAIIDQAQPTIHKQTVSNRAMMSCHPASGRYVDKIMGSIVLDLSAKNEKFTMVHPEGNFAIGGDKPYSDDHYTIFSMAKQKGSAILQSSGHQPDYKKIMSKAIDLKFNVRGVGCGKNVYCSIESMVPKNPRI